MKYQYPAKFFLYGLIGFYLFSIFIFFSSIYPITNGFWELRLIFIISVYLLGYFYFYFYNLYKNRYIKIDIDGVEYQDTSKKYKINNDDIEVIINSRHQVMLKIFDVLHICSKSGKYFYVSHELDKYQDFKKDLRNKYPNKFIELDTVIRKELDKENLRIFAERQFLK